MIWILTNRLRLRCVVVRVGDVVAAVVGCWWLDNGNEHWESGLGLGDPINGDVIEGCQSLWRDVVEKKIPVELKGSSGILTVHQPLASDSTDFRDSATSSGFGPAWPSSSLPGSGPAWPSSSLPGLQGGDSSWPAGSDGEWEYVS
ncbi:hypothetical protein Tco_1254269 [Tanacetum coccineum]